MSMIDNLPSEQEIRDPSPDSHQLYEPKMVAHICFMFKIYLELHLKLFLEQLKVLKRGGLVCSCVLGFRLISCG